MSRQDCENKYIEKVLKKCRISKNDMQELTKILFFNENGILRRRTAEEMEEVYPVETLYQCNKPTYREFFFSREILFAARKLNFSLFKKCGISIPDYINYKDPAGNCALHHAAEENDAITLNFLLENGAKVDEKTNWGLTALIISIEIGTEIECANILLNHGASVNLVLPAGDTIVHCKAKNMVALPDLLPRFLLLGADFDAKNNVGETALHWAASWGSLNDFTSLLNGFPDITCRDNAGETAFEILNRKYPNLKNKKQEICGKKREHYNNRVEILKLISHLKEIDDVATFCETYANNQKLIDFHLDENLLGTVRLFSLCVDFYFKRFHSKFLNENSKFQDAKELSKNISDDLEPIKIIIDKLFTEKFKTLIISEELHTELYLKYMSLSMYLSSAFLIFLEKNNNERNQSFLFNNFYTTCEKNEKLIKNFIGEKEILLKRLFLYCLNFFDRLLVLKSVTRSIESDPEWLYITNYIHCLYYNNFQNQHGMPQNQIQQEIFWEYIEFLISHSTLKPVVKLILAALPPIEIATHYFCRKKFKDNPDPVEQSTFLKSLNKFGALEIIKRYNQIYEIYKHSTNTQYLDATISKLDLMIKGEKSYTLEIIDSLIFRISQIPNNFFVLFLSSRTGNAIDKLREKIRDSLPEAVQEEINSCDQATPALLLETLEEKMVASVLIQKIYNFALQLIDCLSPAGREEALNEVKKAVAKACDICGWMDTYPLRYYIEGYLPFIQKNLNNKPFLELTQLFIKSLLNILCQELQGEELATQPENVKEEYKVLKEIRGTFEHLWGLQKNVSIFWERFPGALRILLHLEKKAIALCKNAIYINAHLKNEITWLIEKEKLKLNQFNFILEEPYLQFKLLCRSLEKYPKLLENISIDYEAATKVAYNGDLERVKKFQENASLLTLRLSDILRQFQTSTEPKPLRVSRQRHKEKLIDDVKVLADEPNVFCDTWESIGFKLQLLESMADLFLNKIEIFSQNSGNSSEVSNIKAQTTNLFKEVGELKITADEAIQKFNDKFEETKSEIRKRKTKLNSPASLRFFEKPGLKEFSDALESLSAAFKELAESNPLNQIKKPKF